MPLLALGVIGAIVVFLEHLNRCRIRRWARENGATVQSISMCWFRSLPARRGRTIYRVRVIDADEREYEGIATVCAFGDVEVEWD